MKGAKREQRPDQVEWEKVSKDWPIGTKVLVTQDGEMPFGAITATFPVFLHGAWTVPVRVEGNVSVYRLSQLQQLSLPLFPQVEP